MDLNLIWDLVKEFGPAAVGAYIVLSFILKNLPASIKSFAAPIIGILVDIGYQLIMGHPVNFLTALGTGITGGWASTQFYQTYKHIKEAIAKKEK